ncbi:peptidase PmbA [Pseudovibrio axinellae]|uniref:Peptidase PmbA n=1 Tax=Pseudovibrio axinellae TaxID=989403 RepID=A0A165YDA8_9HYPH|nr:TldD/PmbA family protein [Pseudovibrio axinellae]KZL18739.1 peptidase PmbA [Pseudovibrio axinellae]SEP94588.1 microcin-processing peptidase 1. Unknown type peptidase. MEROPS family U62 [Pseudovibrio axinellae]
MTDAIADSKLEEQALSLVKAAKAAGADAADALAVTGMSLSVSVREGAVESTDRAEGNDVTLRVFVGKQVASISSNASDDPAQLAARAVEMAKVTPEDPFAGLAEPERLLKKIPSLDLMDPRHVNAEELTKAALDAEAAALGVQGVSKSGGAGASWGLSGIVLATSDGFVGAYQRSRSGFSMTAIAGEGTGMERDYEFDSRTYWEDLMQPEDVGRIAGERTVRRLNPRQIKTCKAPVVYEPRAARSLLGHFAGAINGASIARGTSFLKEQMGQQVFAKGITISDDPFKARGGGTAPFDAEGTGAQYLDMVEDGMLAHWFLDGYSARELGLLSNGRARRAGSSTSPGATNLTLHAGEKKPEEILREIGEGLLVTDLIGHGANGVTGDYSRGASGYWVENGEIAYPVSEVTIAGNLKDMFLNLTPASDLDDRYAVATPTVVIEGMTIAGS